MKNARTLIFSGGLGLFALILQPAVCLAGTVANPPDNHNNVTWGNPPFGTNILDLSLTGAHLGRKGEVPAEQYSFFWTNGLAAPGPDGKLPFNKDPDYDAITLTGPAENKADPRSPDSTTFHLVPPNDDKIKDWAISDAAGNQIKGAAFTANKQAFLPLNNLPNSPFRIAQLIGTGDASANIYIGVDLVQYLMSNPNGIDDGNFVFGETLGELNVSVVNGHILNLAGIVFATSPLEFDPNSPDGFVPSGGDTTWLNSAAYQQVNGPIAVSAIVSSAAPEPGTNTFLSTGLVLLATSRLLSRWKRRGAVRLR